MTDSIPDAKLRSRRIPYRRRVLVTPEDKADRRYEGAFDISMGGMFIATMLPLEVGERFVCEMEIENLKFQAAVRVAWIRTFDGGDDRPVGMAVKFVDLNPIQKRLLHRQILHHTQGGGELRGRQPAPPWIELEILLVLFGSDNRPTGWRVVAEGLLGLPALRANKSARWDE